MSFKRKVGYLAGVFDYCHKGHVNIIKKAAEMCDELVIAIVSDNFAFKYKEQIITYKEDERMEMVRKLGLSNNIVIVDDNAHEPFYAEYGVTHIFHGTDWEKESYIDFMGRSAINERNIEVVMLPHTKGISSTQIRSTKVRQNLKRKKGEVSI